MTTTATYAILATLMVSALFLLIIGLALERIGDVLKRIEWLLTAVPSNTTVPIEKPSEERDVA